MAELSTVARPYAKAAFEYAQQTGKVADWSAMLGFAAQLAADADFADYLSRPTLTAAQQGELFLQAAGNAIDAEGRNFITHVIAHKRLAALPAISSLFDALKAEAEKAADVEVTSAFSLSDAQQSALAAELTRKLGRQVKLTTLVDSSLIGGVVVRSGDLVIDGSVRGKLSKLAATLNS
jgi:F-type H+-transporting ATPase subunit delta